MIWTNTQNLEGIVGWLKLTGEDDPKVTFFLSLKPDVLNFNARRRFAFRDIDRRIQTVMTDLDIAAFAWSQFEYAATDWLVARVRDENATPPRLIASGASSHAAALADMFDIHSIVPCVPTSPQDTPAFTETENPIPDYGLVTDDGLPFLNRAFADAPGISRFKSVWIQSANATTHTNGILRESEINHYQSMLDEAGAYRIISEELIDENERASILRHTSHGAAVADLPLLGVQIPSRIIADTSSLVMPGYILSGLIWAMEELRARHGDTNLGKLYVNLSLGSQGGPDGPDLLADWLDYLVDLYDRIYGDKLIAVCAYGNSYRSRMVARGDGPTELGWCILPDDRTASVCLIRGVSDVTTARIAPPGSNDFGSINQVLTTSSGKPVAAILPFQDAFDQGVTIYVDGTAPGFGSAPAGEWKIHAGAAGDQISLNILRDDTPVGYVIAGRQSYFEHPDAYSWDAEMRDFTNPGNSPITRKGSTTSHAGASQTIHFAGALVGDGIGTRARASRYSSSGDSAISIGALDGPSHAARADDSTNLPGVPASGVLTGSRMRLSGTSAAAPIVLRKIINGTKDLNPPPIAEIERIGGH